MAIIEASSPRVGGQAGDTGELVLQTQPEGREGTAWQMKSEGRLSGLEEASLLVVFRPSTDGVRPHHIREGYLLYSMFTDLNVTLIQKHSHRNTQNNI